MVGQTKRRGASVADVAQRHGVNANLLFGWRRLYQKGLLVEEESCGKARFPAGEGLNAGADAD